MQKSGLIRPKNTRGEKLQKPYAKLMMQSVNLFTDKEIKTGA